MICLHIDIHSPEGYYASTERRWYDTEREIPNRLQVCQDLLIQDFIQRGYIIGNVYTTKSIETILKYCKQIDESCKDMEVCDV